jgi:hypothetical protein
MLGWHTVLQQAITTPPRPSVDNTVNATVSFTRWYGNGDNGDAYGYDAQDYGGTSFGGRWYRNSCRKI